MNNLMEFISQMIKDTGKGLKGYLKAQLILMGIIFIILAIGLRILKVPYFIWISIVVSIVDVLPVLGAGIVIVPWSVISFILGNSYLGKGLALIYIILIITRQILEPKIMGKEIGVRPLYTFLATILGSLIFGPIGLILGPLIAVLVTSIIRTKKNIDSRK
ncbi:MAG: AI-2E family transporter [Tissierellia bacterium]|nr:AI-2E family transporter [Tissierellia bacterium]